ncbi:MAG TPA: hypothetical protein VE258_16740 [Ktedonobacterales bacterium]|nr:hypothetical protein [Ktedonobacterales bacterium]
MHNKETQAARRNQGESAAGVQRLELLWWRFSEGEIQRLSVLQLVHRERPNALDLPLEECRLRFARWLFETGRLSERAGCRLEGQPWAQEAEGQAVGEAAEVLRRQAAVPAAHASLPADERSGEPPPPSAQRRRPAEGRLILLGAWSRIRRGMARVAAFGRELGRMDYLSDEGRTWGPYSPWNPYGPYGPHGPYGSARSVADDPWLWMRFRHDG